jgi:hypothetical protein
MVKSHTDLVNAPSINSKAVKLFNMVPLKYNISRFPKKIIESMMRSEMPDLSLFPPDLLLHFLDHISAFYDPVCLLHRLHILFILAKRYSRGNYQKLSDVY